LLGRAEHCGSIAADTTDVEVPVKKVVPVVKEVEVPVRRIVPDFEWIKVEYED
jgi:hypothetical protein